MTENKRMQVKERIRKSRRISKNRKKEREFKIQNGFLFMLNEEEYFKAYSEHSRPILHTVVEILR